MQTPIVYGDYLYACGDNGLLSCYDARTGKSIYRQRLGNGSTGFTASAVAADGKLYFTNENGDIHVVRAGPEFELLATNSLNEVCMATPAVSDGMLIVRAENHVYAIGRPPDRTRNAPRGTSERSRILRVFRPGCKCSRQSS
jgi:outer membrane protein assembly factor BamB